MATSEGPTPDEAAGMEEQKPTGAPPPGRRRFWLVAAACLIVVAVVGLIIGVSLGTRQGAPLAGSTLGAARPNIVVGSPSAVVSAVASPSASAVPSAVIAGATAAPSVAGGTTYVVQPGDTLRSIAQEQYGDATQWPKIYQANRDVIGADPDALVAGTTLKIP